MSIRALSVASVVGTLPKHVVRPSSSTSSEAAAMIMARASSVGHSYGGMGRWGGGS